MTERFGHRRVRVIVPVPNVGVPGRVTALDLDERTGPKGRERWWRTVRVHRAVCTFRVAKFLATPHTPLDHPAGDTHRRTGDVGRSHASPQMRVPIVAPRLTCGGASDFIT